MSLADVCFQSHAQRVIQRALARRGVPHAYLFYGPDGVGKEKTAIGLASLLLCSEPTDRAIDLDRQADVGMESLRVNCETCDDCRATGAGSHPDLHLIYRQLNREHPDATVRKKKALSISVEVLRFFLIDRVRLTPQRGAFKVFIVREAERMTLAAQNALLKSLEEPPDGTVIILLARSEDRLLPTTRSRCQSVRFDALPTAFVATKLLEAHPSLSSDESQWYAHMANGSIRVAMDAVDDELFQANASLLEGLATIADGPADPTKSWSQAAKALAEGHKKRDPDMTETEATRLGIKSLGRLASTWFADILHLGVGDELACINKAQLEQMRLTATRMSSELAAQAIERVARAEHQLDLNANTQLCLETLLADLARLSRGQRLSRVG